MKQTSRLRQVWMNYGLTIVLMIMFLASWAGQFATGLRSHNEDLLNHGQAQLTAAEYLTSGHFIEATFENWESEFLQMAVFVVLTAELYQRGSAESNPLPDEEQTKTRYKVKRYFVKSPFLRRLYENSLSLTLFALFAISFCLHLYGGWREHNLKEVISGHPDQQATLFEFLGGADFWFQSFQNWQSEFLSVAAIVVFTIFLRQKGSAQSKELDCPHWKTED